MIETHSAFSNLEHAKTIVVKIGTRVIDDEKEHFNKPLMKTIVKDIADLMAQGIRVILVSSGAVGQGLRALGVAKRPKSLPLRQAYAAIGQGRLMNQYNELFAEHKVITAQVLLTCSDLDRRDAYLNATETLNHLLTIGVVPILNENDTVSTHELRFTDNDHLASLIAGKMNADLLVLLTTVDGLFKSFDPATKTGELVELIDQNLEEFHNEVNGTTDEFSIGGMKSKLEAARKAASKGVLVAIANGRKPGILRELLSGQAKATWMIPSKKRMAAWKYYLAFAKQPCGGKLIVDAGAANAIQLHGKSLLASGIVSVMGKFMAKNLIQVLNPQGEEIARGLSNFSSREIQSILGKKSEEIEEILHHPKSTVVVHRDNLVLQT